MEPVTLDQLIKELKTRFTPPVPSSLTNEVWANIHVRNREQFPDNGGKRWLTELIQPRYAFLAFLIATLVGISPSFRSQDTYQGKYVRAALNLEIFSEHSPLMPSTLLEK